MRIALVTLLLAYGAGCASLDPPAPPDAGEAEGTEVSETEMEDEAEEDPHGEPDYFGGNGRWAIW